MKNLNLCKAVLFALATLCFYINTTAQYVQTGPPLLDKTAYGVNLQASSVSISADGNIAVAGYPNREHRKGGFTMYQRSGNQWQALFNYTGPVGSQMGYFTSISGDGSTVAVGFKRYLLQSFDSAWVFVRSGNTWIKQASIISRFESNSSNMMSYDGNTLLLNTCVWVRSNGGWYAEDTIDSGHTLSLSGDGNSIAMIGNVNGGIGKVYIRQGHQWVQLGGDLVAVVPNPSPNPNQGLSGLTISGDGNVVSGVYLNSIYRHGAVFFRRVGNGWVQDTSVIPQCEVELLSFSHDGSKVTGLLRSNDHYINPKSYYFNGTSWVTDNTQNSWAVENCGEVQSFSYISFTNTLTSIICSTDSSGTKSLLSNAFTDPAYGGIRYFTYNNNTWAAQGPALLETVQPGNTFQGQCAVISGDGNTIAYGGRMNNYSTVWVYKRDGYNWSLQTTLQCPDGNETQKYFSTDVAENAPLSTLLAISENGNTLAVATPNAKPKTDGTADGAVYVYKRNGNNWSFDDSLMVPWIDPQGGGYGHHFGTTVSLSADGKTLIAGTSDSASYVFIDTLGWQLEAQLGESLDRPVQTVLLSADGNTALVTEETYNNNQGAVHIYQRAGGYWTTQQCCITMPANITSGNTFGTTACLSGDGKRMVASTYTINASYNLAFPYHYDNSMAWLADFGNNNLCYASGGGCPYGNSGYQMWMSYSGDTLFEMLYNTNPGNYNDFPILMFTRNGNSWTRSYTLPLPYTNDKGDLNYNVVYQYGWMGVSKNMKYVIKSIPTAGYGDGGIYIYQRSTLAVSIVDSISPTCNTATDGKIKIHVTGGVAPINMVWSTGAANVDSITGLASGTYAVTITDADSVQVVREYELSPANNFKIIQKRGYLPCAGGNGLVYIAMQSGTQPFNYAWNGVPQNNDTITITHTGMYAVTVTDIGGCTTADSLYVEAQTPWSTVSYIQPNCGNNGQISVSAYGGTPPLTYQWSNGSVYATDSMLGPGTYHVTVSDAVNCSITAMATLTNHCNNVIKGKAFFDNNNNCVKDPTDFPVPYILYATAGGGISYGNTDALGNYEIDVPAAGNYNVYVANWGGCGFSLCTGHTYPPQVTFAAIGDTAVVDLPVIDTANDLRLTANVPTFNPGFTGAFNLNYGNTKNRTVPGTVITMVYDTSMTYVSSIPSYTSINTITRTITWVVTAQIFGTQFIRTNFTISQYAPLPSAPVHCTITAPGNDCNLSNNTLNLLLPFASALDPNEKTSTVTDSTIDYTIYFQNTGNDTTHMIVVYDTLSPYIDAATIQTLVTSHGGYTFHLQENGIASWNFTPIYLPDSATNPVASHGFITFRVKKKAHIADGTTITNQAHIYFDYNSPVATNVVADTTYCPPFFANVSASICAGSTYNFYGSQLSTAGNYTTNKPNEGRCDSIIQLLLNVLQTATTNTTASVCMGQGYTFNGNTYYNSGTYTATYPTSNGCDSTVNLNLTVLDTTTTILTAGICNGQSYLFNGNQLYTTGSYTATYQNINGCDSTVTLNLTVSDTVDIPQSASICAGDYYLFNGNMLTTAGVYTYTAHNVNGCDSTVNLNLTVLDTTTTTLTTGICNGQSYLFNGNQLYTTGSYTATFQNINGCDSTVTLNLTVSDTVDIPQSASICAGDYYLFNGNMLTTAGVYTYTAHNVNGCDSMLTLNLSVADTSVVNLSAAICKGESYLFNNNLLNTTGTYTTTLQNINGCDSVVTLNLVVDSITANVQILSADTLVAQAQGHIQWFNCSTQTLLNDTGAVFVATATGSYAAVVSNNNCTDTTTCVDVVISNIKTLQTDRVQVFPNPFNQTINIVTNHNGAHTAILYDAKGALLYKWNYNNNNTTLDLLNYSPGLYLIQITFDGYTAHKKLIKL